MTTQISRIATLDRQHPAGRYSRRITSGPVSGALWVEYTEHGAVAAEARWIVYADGRSRKVGA